MDMRTIEEIAADKGDAGHTGDAADEVPASGHRALSDQKSMITVESNIFDFDQGQENQYPQRKREPQYLMDMLEPAGLTRQP
jgi:hypothetical protein